MVSHASSAASAFIPISAGVRRTPSAVRAGALDDVVLPSVDVHAAAGSGPSLLSIDIPFTAGSDLTLAVDTPPPTFEPNMPDATALVGMGSVVLLCIAAGLVWANEVVPTSRTKLAISKNRGEVKEYLDGLRTEEGGNDPGGDEKYEVKPNVGDGRDIERWLFSDWLNSGSGAKPGRQKEPALPILKEAKWNSGDNPILVASALIGLCVVIASVTERVGTQLGAS